MTGKPIVLHLGDAIKYNHEFYNTDFLSRFEVIRAQVETREEFIDALRNKRFAPLRNYHTSRDELIG
jgi:hypothetical protein